MPQNEVKIKVTAEDDASKVIDGVDARTKSLGDTARKSGDDLDTFGKRGKKAFEDVAIVSERTKIKMTDLELKTRHVKDQMKLLDQQAGKSKESLRILAEALLSTDDAAQRLDISKAMSKVQADLQRTLAAKKIKMEELIDLDPGDGPPKFLKRLSDGLERNSGKLKLTGKILGGVLALGIVPALASTVAGAMGAALASSLAVGVMGAGIALAVSKDEGIQDAGKRLGQKFMGAVGREVKVFRGPILEGLGMFDDFGERLSKKLGDAFRALAPSIIPFLSDVIQGLESVTDAIVDIAKDAGPALEGFGDGFRLLMDGVGEGLRALTENGEEIGSAFRTLGGLLGDIIEGTATFVGWLGKIGDSMPWMQALSQHYEDAATTSDKAATGVAAVVKELDAGKRAAEGQRDAFLELTSAMRAQSDPVFALLKAQRDLEKAQEATRKATEEHGAESLQAKDALQDQYNAALALQEATGKLGSTFDGKLTPAMRRNLLAAGVTGDEIDRIEGLFGDAKRAGDRFAKRYQAQVSTSGLAKAFNDLTRAKYLADQIDGRVIRLAMQVTGTRNVSEAAASVRKQYYAHGGIIGSAADGGIKQGTMWVGEQGPELVSLPPGSQVHSNPDSRRMVEQSKGGAGGQEGVLTMRLDTSGLPRWAAAFMEMIRAEIRQGSGNVQYELGMAGR